LICESTPIPKKPVAWIFSKGRQWLFNEQGGGIKQRRLHMRVQPISCGKASALWHVVLILAFGMVLIPQAVAYVLEGPHVLELMTHKKADAKTLLVEQQVIIEDPALSEHPVE
jgi:hypothetical protein